MRVTLRPVGPGDQDEFIERALASTALHDPWIVPPRTPEEFARYLAALDGHSSLGFVICRRTTGDIVGYVTVSQLVRASYQRAVIGYGAFLPYARQGYMTEGLRLLLGHAFGPLGLHRLEADIQPGNTASRALIKRLGFQLEGLSRGLIQISGVWRDHERWAITKEEVDALGVKSEPERGTSDPLRGIP